MEEVGLTGHQALVQHRRLVRRLHGALLIQRAGAFAPLAELVLEHGMLAAEGVDDLKPVGHLLILGRVLVGLPVSREYPLERGVNHDLERLHLLFVTVHHKLTLLAWFLWEVVLPVCRLLHARVQLEVVGATGVVGVSRLGDGHRAPLAIPAEGELLAAVLSRLAIVAEGAGDEAPSKTVDDEITSTHRPLRNVVLVHAAA
mmetsp:Transcript_50921/g.131294  ORF Transcript_50921/g.131294 Transcript_50921/m.131294 type:complete len:201 (-) Transcript_50921:1615-2217(-)